MKVAVTGAEGLLGWHLRCALHAQGIDVVPVVRRDFASSEVLAGALESPDVVVHAAGANRGVDEEVAATNVGLAERLAAAVGASPSIQLVIYLNSTQHVRPTSYGRSKRAAADILGGVARSGRGFLDVILPGVFGEHGKPYYNSVVATFCHQLAIGEDLTINDDAELELIHTQDVADGIVDAAKERRSGTVRPTGQPTTVRGLADKLTEMHASYDRGVVPPTADSFDRALFNTLRSYRYPGKYPTKLDPKVDQRGRLVELVKADTGGQMFISTTEPGVTRGNHYHRRKVERFVVVDGTATISLRKLFSDDVVTFEVNGQDPVAIDMPTMHTHNITNIGDTQLITLFWADEIFDPERPDTFAESV